MSGSERVLTGIPGLEEMLNGGFPRGRVILLVGGPGTGKTIFSSQFIFSGIEKHNENGVYVSLDESQHHYLKEMSAFGWNLEKEQYGITKNNCFTIRYLQCCDYPAYRISRIYGDGTIEVWGVGSWSGGYASKVSLSDLRKPQPKEKLYIDSRVR